MKRVTWTGLSINTALELTIESRAVILPKRATFSIKRSVKHNLITNNGIIKLSDIFM